MCGWQFEILMAFNEKNDQKDWGRQGVHSASGESWPPENRIPNLSMEASKASRRKGQCLQVCLPSGSRQHRQEKAGDRAAGFFWTQRSWGQVLERSHVPFSASSRETPTQHLKCLHLGFRRLEMQAGEIIQILVRIRLKTGLSSKQWWAKAFYLRRFLPCKESYGTCTW